MQKLPLFFTSMLLFPAHTISFSHLHIHSWNNLDRFYSLHTLKKKKKLPTGFLPRVCLFPHPHRQPPYSPLSSTPPPYVCTSSLLLSTLSSAFLFFNNFSLVPFSSLLFSLCFFKFPLLYQFVNVIIIRLNIIYYALCLQ